MLCSQRGKMARWQDETSNSSMARQDVFFFPSWCWGQGRSQDSCLVFDGRLGLGLAALRVCPNASECCLKAEMYAHMSITGPESSLVYLDLFSKLFASFSCCMQQCNHHATASACFFRPAKAWSSNAVLPYTKWSAAFWVDQAWQHKLDVMLRGMLWHLEDCLFSPGIFWQCSYVSCALLTVDSLQGLWVWVPFLTKDLFRNLSLARIGLHGPRGRGALWWTDWSF